MGSGKAAAAVWVPASSYTPRDTRWLWWPRVPAGHVTIVAGRGGSGKGLFVTDITARITTGASWPCSKEVAQPRSVIWVETEDDIEETMLPRLIAAGADRARVMFMTPRQFFALNHRQFYKDYDVGLVVLSPLVSCLESCGDTNKELDVRDALDTITAPIRGTDTAIIGLMHLNKKIDLTTVERILGSGAFANFSRSVLFTVAEQDQDGHDVGDKRLIHEKYNLSLKADDLIFTPKPTKGERDQYVAVKWNAADLNANLDEKLERRQRANGKGNGHANDDNDPPASAKQWLLTFLIENGKAKKTAVIEAALEAGFSKKAVQHAFDRCDLVVAEQPTSDNKVTFWRLVPSTVN